jgi:hypothetical protein
MAIKRSAVAAVAHLREAAAAAVKSGAARSEREVALADKFNLARLNGGKSPFDVSSNRLLKAGAKAGGKYPAKLPRSAPGAPLSEVKDVYSLEYLLGEDAKEAADAKESPFDVASDKLM